MESTLHHVGVTPHMLDELFDLRFPWDRNKNRKVDFESVQQWMGPLPARIEDALFEITWPVLCKMTTTLKPTSQPKIVDECLELLRQSSASEYLTRAVAFIMLLDQCPRMFHAQSTNARWVGGFFDPLAQTLISYLLDRRGEEGGGGGILSYEAWSAHGYDLEGYMVITSLILSAADHSESLERHHFLRWVNEERRIMLEHHTGLGDPFASKLEADKNDTLAFSRWMRSGISAQINNVYEFFHLRMAIIDLHYPIIERFGRYPWRNGSLGRSSTAQELQFLEDSGHFGEVDRAVQEQIEADIAAERWTPFS